jgi:hypothetical protein
VNCTTILSDAGLQAKSFYPHVGYENGNPEINIAMPQHDLLFSARRAGQSR